MFSETRQSSASKYAVNQAIGKSPGLGWMPINQIFYWVMIVTLVFVAQGLLQNTPLRFSFQTACFTSTTLCLAYWALTGSKDHQYFDRFRALAFVQTTWIRARVKIKWTNAGLPKKEKVGKMGNPWRKLWNKQSEVFTAIEDCSDLVCYGQINLQGHKVGFYLLEPRKGQFRFMFRWRVRGVHPTIFEEGAATLLEECWEKGINEFLPEQEITFEQSSFTDDGERQAELDGLLDTDNELAQALVYSQKARTRQLTKQGLRKVKRTTITAAFTTGLVSREDKDIISRMLKWLVQMGGSLWETFGGQKEEMNHQRLQKLVSLAFKDGFLHYHSIFTNTMKLEAQPCTAQENWSDDYAVYHKAKAPPLPQLLILDQLGLRVEVKEPNLHVSTVLFSGERGKSSVPIRNPEWVYLPIHQKYVGFMQFDQVKDFGSARNQFRYSWNILERDSSYNCRIVTQFSGGNLALHKFNLERSTRNATGVALRAMQGRTVDVVAEENIRQSVEAQKALNQGDSVIHVSAGIFLYRNNPQALDQDFANLADCLPGTAPYRERNILPRIWLQSLPYVNEGFLKLPSDRSDTYLSRHATGLLPLASTKAIDNKGLELVALEGGSPIYLDAFNPSHHFRWMAIAQPRAGKSLLTAGYAEQAWLRGQPVVAFDVPRADGSSTYTDMVNSIAKCGGKAAYYDIGSKSNNLLHLYNFADSPTAKYRRQSLADLRINGTLAIGMGSIEDPSLEEAMKDIVTQSLAAFDAQPQIQSRFAAANRAGVGTQEWRNSPTLHDYLAFLIGWLTQYFKENEATLPSHYRDAAGTLVQKIRTILHSQLGQAIAQPSDFDNNLDILVFALTGEYSNYEMRIMALAGYAALLSRALTTEVCHFLVDESPQLFPYPAFAARVGGLATNGAKWGVRLGIISQYPEVVFNSAAGESVKQTLNNVLVGHIQDQVIPSLSESLGFYPELLQSCAHESFKPSGSALRSHWLVKVDRNYTFCGYYPSELLLALTANDLPEAAARKRVMDCYPDDPVRGVLEFSKLYAAARRSGKPMSQIQPNRNPNHLRAVS